MPQPPPTELTCEGAVFCEATYEEMEAAGFDTTQMQANDQQTLASIQEQVEAAAAAAVSSTFYNGWVNFYLYRSPTNCTGTVNYNGYCGWLYHKYQAIIDGIPKPVYTSSYPGRSGNNYVPDKWVRNKGPLPNTWVSSKPPLPSPTRKWGWMKGNPTGYEPNNNDSFYPGLWRLDPWTVYSGPNHTGTERDAFEIHGGRNASDFWTTGTYGCMRLPSASIISLKSMWDNRTDNKKNPYAPMTVYYP